MKIACLRSLVALLLLYSGNVATVLANEAPEVSGVTASQRPDESKLVDIRYSLADADGDECTVWVVISDDNGASWKVPAWTFSGDVGPGVSPGAGKHVIWDAGADIPGAAGTFKARVYADDGNGPAPMVVVPAGFFPFRNTGDPSAWVYVPTFLIDKYEVTNEFYCQFLNNADPSSAHWRSGMEISRGGSDGNYFYFVYPSKEKYPIRNVNRSDADAFAAWRSALEGATFRLPTEPEWEKAAAWQPPLGYWRWAYQDNACDNKWANVGNWYGNTLCVGSFNGTGGELASIGV